MVLKNSIGRKVLMAFMAVVVALFALFSMNAPSADASTTNTEGGWLAYGKWGENGVYPSDEVLSVGATLNLSGKTVLENGAADPYQPVYIRIVDTNGQTVKEGAEYTSSSTGYVYPSVSLSGLPKGKYQASLIFKAWDYRYTWYALGYHYGTNNPVILDFTIQ